MTGLTADTSPSAENWQDLSLAGLRAIELEAMPSFEVLLLDDLAVYTMGCGPLPPPFTVEHGSRVVSALLGAVINSARYTPTQTPVASANMSTIRERFVRGAGDFADRGRPGLSQLVNRIIPAALGELEIHKDAPEDQTRSLFYYTVLAVASGPLNLLEEDAAAGALELFDAWDEVFGSGFVLPWRQEVPA
ncbi:MAG: hypothetical protein QOE89_141 [Pseudonocardiales bacterium]|nr:hypothetical protein [Pseudonocardiales bacterium]